MTKELVLVEDHPLVGRALVRLLSPHFLVSWTTDPIAAQKVVGRIPILVCAAHFDDDTKALLEAAPRSTRIVYGEHAAAFTGLCEASVEEPLEVLGVLTRLAHERR